MIIPEGKYAINVGDPALWERLHDLVSWLQENCEGPGESIIIMAMARCALAELVSTHGECTMDEALAESKGIAEQVQAIWVTGENHLAQIQ